jgi:putative PIN family toxin of toxin-antitoxin system
MTPGAVFDCMAFLQGAARPNGPARACFRLIDEGKATLSINAEILAEVRDVLNRPKMQKRFPSLTPEWVAEFMQNVEAKAVTVGAVLKAFTLERDPKDEPYLSLAIAVGASYLVSRDKDLLDLRNDKDFRARYPGLTILDPVAFLEAIAGEENASSPTMDEA